MFSPPFGEVGETTMWQKDVSEFYRSSIGLSKATTMQYERITWNMQFFSDHGTGLNDALQ
jgi:hypothetical protein